MKIKNEYHRIQIRTTGKILVRLPSKQHLQMKRGIKQFWHLLETEFQDITKERFSKAAKPECFSYSKKCLSKNWLEIGFQHYNHEFKFTTFVEKIARKTGFVENKIEFHEFRRFLYSLISFQTHKKPA